MEKEKLIKGKWYKACKNQDFYIKYDKTVNIIYAWCSEHIACKNIYYNHGGQCGEIKYLTPINIKEIAHLLPKNHSDLKQLNKNYEIW